MELGKQWRICESDVVYILLDLQVVENADLSVLQLSKALKEKANLETLWDGTLYHIKDLPFAQDMQDMPDVFTPFRGKVSTSSCKIASGSQRLRKSQSAVRLPSNKQVAEVVLIIYRLCLA